MVSPLVLGINPWDAGDIRHWISKPLSQQLATRLWAGLNCRSTLLSKLSQVATFDILGTKGAGQLMV